MIIEGERVKALLAGAKAEVILCSPFIKSNVLRILLDVTPQDVSVKVFTRWRPPEVAAGLSDLEVFDIANERPSTEVRLSPSLHAKLYVSDDQCLLGSANLTAAALGWRRDSNLEILIPAERSDPDVAFLLAQLESATPATFQMRAEVEALAEAIEVPVLPDAEDIPPASAASPGDPWLPRCATPDKLYEVYQDPHTTVVAENTRSDALADLEDLLMSPGLSSDEFRITVGHTLSRIPSFRTFLERVPAGLTDVQGEEITAHLRQHLRETGVRKQWSIVRQWIAAFFADEYEVAPQSFVVRLKPR